MIHAQRSDGFFSSPLVIADSTIEIDHEDKGEKHHSALTQQLHLNCASVIRFSAS
ncbi:hypothetical protein RLOC_00014660 [Lonchura striata]|uniref:Uncharacterized protein n=1 Tax=Lonchura striata TaxID=40157 RepID=A0A218V3M6_9PASE|nr:hypothetical protein RLOC_00014660 [Lonchura striata domestica]